MVLPGKKCLVTGGAGFIGSHLVDALLQYDCQVRALDNLVNGKWENISHHSGNDCFQFMRGDITDPADVELAMEGIEVVFHLACLGVRHSLAHPFENHRVNAEGSLMMLDAAYRAGVGRFVYCSSSEVYGTAEYVPMPESHPPHPCTVYGSSKLAGEAYTRAYYKTYEMPTVILRPFNTYGPRSHHEGDAGEMIPKSIVRVLNGKPITVFGDGSQTRDFTYVEDIAQALLAGAEKDGLIGQTLNVGSNFEISIRDLAYKISDMVGNPESEVIFTPSRPGDVLRLYADPSKFEKQCGWKSKVSLEEGLARTIDFFRNHPSGLSSLMQTESGRNWEADSI
jgi:UDP-glucose 4-epimerase